MSTVASFHFALAPTAIDCGLVPRLAQRCELRGGSRSWLGPEFTASAAFISLAPSLVCVFEDEKGAVVTHQRIGEMGLSVHEAWNSAAQAIIHEKVSSEGVEFWVRDAQTVLGPHVPRGIEVRKSSHPPTSWLAHPQLFTVLNTHFTQVLKPRNGLTYVSRDLSELFIFDAVAQGFARSFSAATTMRYSVGFPLVESL